ncbi:MAG TPA: hypothetical protein VMT72_04285 [Pseudolabrys sp.]|nr:hypothetical protein [Pseudolabrys sp.]
MDVDLLRTLLAFFCICCAVFLAYYKREGWGWMIFSAYVAIP